MRTPLFIGLPVILFPCLDSLSYLFFRVWIHLLKIFFRVWIQYVLSFPQVIFRSPFFHVFAFESNLEMTRPAKYLRSLDDPKEEGLCGQFAALQAVDQRILCQ